MKHNKRRHWIRNYHLFSILLFGISCWFLNQFFFQLFVESTTLSKEHPLAKLIQLIYFILTFLIWFFVSLFVLQTTHYKRKTKRCYWMDYYHFKKPYIEMLSFFSNNDPYQLPIDALPNISWNQADGIILCQTTDQDGKKRLLHRNSDSNGNLVSFGLPGSGKTTTQAATTAIRFNANVKKGGCGVFAISIKGDLLNFVKDKRTNIKLFTPDQVAGSCHYDPLNGVDSMNQTERRSFLENMSIIICPDELGDNSAFFVSGARDYFCGIVHYLLYLRDTGKKAEPLKFPEIVDTILSGNVFDITLTIKHSGCQIAGEYTNSYEGSSEKNVSGIYNHLCKAVRPFNSGALRTLFDGNGNCITPDDLTTGDIYIDVPQDKYQIYAPAMAIIITNFLMAFMQRADVSSNQQTLPILFLLDEAVQLNLDFQLLSQAMSTLRSKKVSLFLLMQSVAQLEGRYGEAHAREIIDLCAYISVFNAQDPKSREFFQKLIGRRKMLKKTAALSSSTDRATTSNSVTEIEEFIFESADFGNLDFYDKKKKQTIHRVLVYANGKYILGETTPCYQS